MRVAVATLSALARDDAAADGDALQSARTLVANLVDTVTPHPSGPAATRRTGPTSIAERLCRGLICTTAVQETHIQLMNAALILRADHELAASSLAVRVAASTGASLHSAVLAGLATGPYGLLGDSGTTPDNVFAELDGPADAQRFVASMGRCSPWFGHPLYPEDDPRALQLLRRLEQEYGCGKSFDAVSWLLSAARSAQLPPPNLHLAIGALSHCLGMPTGASHLIATTSRVAGWIAHALEEHLDRSLPRQRAIYVGVPPSAPGPPRTGP